MDPFDLAWEFLKAPLDESSIVYSPRDPEDPFTQDMMFADFDDSEEGVMYGSNARMPTGKRLPMAVYRDRRGMNVVVRVPDIDHGDGDPEAGWQVGDANFSVGDRGSYSADNVDVDSDYRRRGIGSAMYSLASLLAQQEQGGLPQADIVQSENQTRAGNRFWDGKETWPPADDTFMTVRTSEPMEHAFSTLRKIK